MARKVKTVPRGVHTITPHLSLREPSKAMEFYEKAFRVEVLNIRYPPNGTVKQAHL